MGYSLGVDLGTTFVAAALATPATVEMVTLGNQSVVTPAAVYLSDDGTLITGEGASLRLVSRPDRVCREVKRRLGSPTPITLGGQPYPVTGLLAALLRDVLDNVTRTQGEPPENVLLTYPANWGPFRRALFEEVPPHAGLRDPPLVTEPEAAAAHYAASKMLAEGETVAVYDLGGGTFDATVLRQEPEGVRILGTPAGIERLGGIDFDEAILSYVDYATGGTLTELDMGNPQVLTALAQLRLDCVRAKEALSVDTETIIPVFLPSGQSEVRLTRSDFEDLVRAQIESTMGALRRTLESARVEPTELSAVLLVGGSSRIPLVTRMVAAELGCPVVVDAHPKYAVALGAAALAAGQPERTTRAIAATPGTPPDSPQPALPAPVIPPSPPLLGRGTTRRGRGRLIGIAVGIALALLLLIALIALRPFKIYTTPPADSADPAPTVATISDGLHTALGTLACGCGAPGRCGTICRSAISSRC
ncbi:MAG TPA: Hsp70 family protein [Pseudonocardiaceae bacterium]|nr:Hsp70 family protein [Pseudonocardiaceae bacterium]